MKVGWLGGVCSQQGFVSGNRLVFCLDVCGAHMEAKIRSHGRRQNLVAPIRLRRTFHLPLVLVTSSHRYRFKRE